MTIIRLSDDKNQEYLYNLNGESRTEKQKFA